MTKKKNSSRSQKIVHGVTTQSVPKEDSKTCMEVVSHLKRWNEKSPGQPKEIDESMALAAAMTFQADPVEAQNMFDTLDLNQVVEDGKFFSFLSGASQRIAWGDARSTLLGTIWALAYQRSDKATKSKIREELYEVKFTFSILDCLPAFLSQTDIPASDLANWLFEIRKNLGHNSALRGLFCGLDQIAICHPQVARDVLLQWTTGRPDSTLDEMASALLGRLRVVDDSLTQKIDAILVEHLDESRRMVFHKSWFTHDHLSPLGFSKYRTLVDRMNAGTNAEQKVAFRFVIHTLSAKHRCDQSFSYAIRWIHSNLDACTEDMGVCSIINSAIECDDRGKTMSLPPLWTLVHQFLPLQTYSEDYWYSLSRLLIKLLSTSRLDFESLIFLIAQKDGGALADQIAEESSLHEFIHVLSLKDPGTLVCNALSSLAEPVRHLGMCLFKGLGTSSLADSASNDWNDNWLAVMILQLRRERFYDETIGRFLLALLPKVEQGSVNIRNLFSDELVFQMKNLPGGCLDAIKSIELNNPIVDLCIKKAETYFENLQKCHSSPINSMAVDGIRRALRLAQKQFQQQMEATKKESPIFGIMSTSYSLYGGKQWRNYIDGTLSPPSIMSDFSHSFEFSRAAIADPDGFSMRRHIARLRMRELVEIEREQRISKV